MTEEEWLAATSPWSLLRHLDADAEGRKPYLFSAACLRRIEQWMPGPASQSVAALLEQLADTRIDRGYIWDALDRARDEAQTEARTVRSGEKRGPMEYAAFAASEWSPAQIAEWAVEASTWAHAGTPEVISTPEERAQTNLIRDIFGNPFRSIALSPEWRTETAVALARQMYESRDFGAMPILADALQDAGCDSDDILAHCRGEGPHVRGCWVVDLVLGL